MIKHDLDVTRKFLIERNEAFRPQATDIGAPTLEMLTSYAYAQVSMKTISHETKRGVGAVAPLIGMTTKDLESLCVGKKILDIGCGEGVLARDLSRLKRTHITALDSDQEALDKVVSSKQIKVVLGSGIDLPEEVNDEQFDVVISSFSSVAWAGSPELRVSAIRSMIDVTKIGGLALIIPIVSNPAYRDQRSAESCNIPKNVSPQDAIIRHLDLEVLYTGSCMDLDAVDYLLVGENEGRISPTFVPGFNSKFNPHHENYSAIVTKLAQ